MIIALWIFAIAAVGVAMYLLAHSLRLKPTIACEQCGYDLRANIYKSRSCPECGMEFGEDFIVRAQRLQPRIWMDWFGVVLLSLGAMVAWLALVATLAVGLNL